MKHMREYELVFDDIHASFAASVGIYTDSCYQLLRPLNLPDRQMNDLLEERKQEAWSNSELTRALEMRLGSNTKVYISLMDKLNRRILLFCRKLKLDDDLKASPLCKQGRSKANKISLPGLPPTDRLMKKSGKSFSRILGLG